MDVKRLGLMCGLGVVALIGFVQLQKMGKPAPVKTSAPVIKEVSNVEYVDILAANVDIQMGTRLTPELIGWKKWPAEALSDSYIDSEKFPEALENYKEAVTRTTIYAGEPILARKVVKTGEQGQMSALLDAGMRGTAVRISLESAAGGFIKPGDRVDVLLTRTGATPAETVSNTIFENIGVLAIGKVYSNSVDGTAYVNGTTALLALSQVDSEIMIEAQSKGEISLILRGLDRNRASATPVSRAITGRNKPGKVGSITVYRAGQPKQVAVQGH